MIRTAWGWAISAWVLIAAAAQDKKVPIPDASIQKEKERQLRDIYKEEYRSKVSADRVAFAEKLLKQGVETKNDRDGQYVMLREAMAIAGEERAVAVAFSAIEALAACFEDVKAFDLKFGVLSKVKSGVKTPADALSLAEHHVTLSRQAWNANRFDVALRALTDAAPTAKAAKDADLSVLVNELSADAKEAKDAYEKVRSAESALAVNADDPEANAQLGWFLCLYKGEGEHGLRLLSKGPPDKGPYADLTRLAIDEPKATSSKDFFALGERWIALGGKAGGRLPRRNAQAQARRLYERALEGSEGLDRAQIEKRISELKDAPAAAGGFSSAGLDLLRLVDPKKDAFAGTWARDGVHVKKTQGGFARLEIPYEPPDEYDLKAVIEQGPSTESVLLLSKAGRSFAVSLKPSTNSGAIYSTAGNVDMKGLSIPPNVSHTLVVSVRSGSVKIAINGKDVEEWKPDPKLLGHIQAWAPKNPRRLGIGANGERVIFQAVSVVEVTGRGKRTRP